MQKRKLERRNEFFNVVEQIQKIRNEIYRSDKNNSYSPGVDETDLTLRKLEELQKELQDLQKEKVSSKRLAGFLSAETTLYCLCILKLLFIWMQNDRSSWAY